ncbi:AI-2E family transporter [Planctomicrobium piriforme]|nr:AI-2E family transporter [Planctomicrobium piriforme]
MSESAALAAPLAADASLSGLAGDAASSALPEPAAATEEKPAAAESLEATTADKDSLTVESRRLLVFEKRESIALTILAGLAILVALYQTRAIMLPVTLAVLLALTLRPVLRKLHKLGIPDNVGAGLIIAGLLAVVLLGVVNLIGPAREWIGDMPANIAKLQEKLHSVSGQFKYLSEMNSQMQKMASGGSGDRPLAVEISQPALSANVALISNTGNFIGAIMLVIGLTFFFLAFGDSMLNNLLRVLDTYSEKKRTVELVYDVEKGVASYLFLVTVINVGLGIATAIALWLLGVPNAALWGVMAAAFNYIPVFGAIAGVLIVAVVSLLSFDSVVYAAIPPLVFLALTTFESNLITPPLLGRSMSLNPILVFLSLIFWGWIWGIGGAFLAVPLLAVTKLTCERFERTKPIAILIEA